MSLIVSPPGYRRPVTTVLLLTGDTITDASPAARPLYAGTSPSPTAVDIQGAGYLPPAFAKSTGFSVGTQVGQFLYASPSYDFDFAFDDFTIDWWEYRLPNHAGGGVFSLNYTKQFASLACFLDTNGIIFCCSNNGSTWDAIYNLLLGSLEYNVQNHFAIMRKDRVLYGYKNGKLNSSLQANVPIGSSSSYFSIGSFWGSYYYFNGYMANFRVIRQAVWPVKGFTPPQNPS